MVVMQRLLFKRMFLTGWLLFLFSPAMASPTWTEGSHSTQIHCCFVSLPYSLNGGHAKTIKNAVSNRLIVFSSHYWGCTWMAAAPYKLIIVFGSLAWDSGLHSYLRNKLFLTVYCCFCLLLQLQSPRWQLHYTGWLLSFSLLHLMASFVVCLLLQMAAAPCWLIFCSPDGCQAFVKNLSNRLIVDFVFFHMAASSQMVAMPHWLIVVFGFSCTGWLVVVLSLAMAALPEGSHTAQVGCFILFVHWMATAHELFFSFVLNRLVVIFVICCGWFN